MSETTRRTREQQDTHFMELALKQAEAAVARGQTPFGAVVVDRNGQLIGEGHNTVRADLDPTAHGEMSSSRLSRLQGGGTSICYRAPRPDNGMQRTQSTSPHAPKGANRRQRPVGPRRFSVLLWHQHQPSLSGFLDARPREEQRHVLAPRPRPGEVAVVPVEGQAALPGRVDHL